MILHSLVCSHLDLCSFIYKPCALLFVMDGPLGKSISNMTFIDPLLDYFNVDLYGLIES